MKMNVNKSFFEKLESELHFHRPGSPQHSTVLSGSQQCIDGIDGIGRNRRAWRGARIAAARAALGEGPLCRAVDLAPPPTGPWRPRLRDAELPHI